jgi:acyl-CoA dehydrogenase
MGQLRLGYGRLRHGFQNLATAQRILDMATKRATERETFGEELANRQAIQFMLGECARDLYIGRLMVLHIAYLIGKKRDFTQENRHAKVWLANMVSKVVDTAIQIHGAAGLTRDVGLGDLLLGVRQQRLVDGPDEVHKWRLGADLVKAYREHGTTASVAGGSLGL